MDCPNIPSSGLSPCIESGEILCCAGDTGVVSFNLELCDQDGTPVLPASGEVAELTLYNRSRQVVLTRKEERSHHISLPLRGDLPRGRYHYRIRVCHDGQWTTVVKDQPLIVR